MYIARRSLWKAYYSELEGNHFMVHLLSTSATTNRIFPFNILIGMELLHQSLQEHCEYSYQKCSINSDETTYISITWPVISHLEDVYRKQ